MPGIGPRSAFTVISYTKNEELIAAVKKNDVQFFTNIKGLGKKTALKIILELSQKFKTEFTTAAVTVEGSGWAVLWKTEAGLAIGQLEKHNLLGLSGAKPVLVLDVWEHAYYLDYLNDRKSYVEKWWSVVNWEDVAKRLG